MINGIITKNITYEEYVDIISKAKYFLLVDKDYITNLQDTLKDREEYCYGLETQLTNLQEKVGQYENPDDMTLMFMWCDEKAKDKIKQLQEENEKNKEYSEFYKDMTDKWKNMSDVFKKSCEEYKSRNKKAIEYIDTHYLHAYEPELLNILQGDDDNENE